MYAIDVTVKQKPLLLPILCPFIKEISQDASQAAHISVCVARLGVTSERQHNAITIHCVKRPFVE